jgi:hypothetical protein
VTPARRPSIPPDQFSWSGRISQPSAPGPVADPVAPYAQPSGPRPSGGTLASHRREPGAPDPGQQAGPPPAGSPEPPWHRRPRWIAALAAVVVLLAGLGTWAGVSGFGSHHKAALAATPPKPKKPKTSELMAALILANKSADAKGLIPPSTCKQRTSTTVTCAAPSSGITGVIFQTFPNQKALYAAYETRVASLSPKHQFKQNFSDCESQLTYGEISWNHLFKHTSKYTVDQMITGNVTDDQAAGRVFCNYTQGQESMVWTQNDGHLMGYVAGLIHTDVWNWWVGVHHNLGIGGSPMDMQLPGTSPSPAMSGMSPSPSMSPSMSPSASMSSMGG